MSLSTQAEQQPETRPFARVARGASGVLLTGLLVAVVVTMLLPPLVGYRRYAITGGSMEPSVPRGSLVWSKEVPVHTLKRGDVITYVPPGGARPVTHRILEITRERDGRPIFRTKGDANRAPDMRRFHLERPTQARYEAHIPHVGWLLILLADPGTRVFLLGIPAVLAALMVVRSLWREGGELVRQREAEAALEGES